MLTLLAVVLSRKNPFFPSSQTIIVQTLVLPNRKKFTVTLPARILRPMPTPEHVLFSEGPAPEEKTPLVSGERLWCKGSAHMSQEGRALRPPTLGATPRRARGNSCPRAIDLAQIRDLLPGSSLSKCS